MPTVATPLASPTKRSYRASPNSSPDLSNDRPSESSSPRVLRAKVSIDRATLLEGPLLPSRAMSSGERRINGDEVDTTPSTPPEAPLEPLVGLGVSGAKEAVKAVEGGVDGGRRPSPQVLAAERQIAELENLPQDVQVTLSKLCSQHWTSQYNALKRSLAAAASGSAAGLPHSGISQPSPPPPTYTLPSFHPSTSRSCTSRVAPNRPLSCPPSVASMSSASPSTPLSEPGAVAAPTSLTPSLANFGFNLTAGTPLTTSTPSSVTPSNEVTGLLADLVQGEPIAVQQHGSSVLVTGVPAAAFEQRPAVPVMPRMEPPSPAIPGLLPGMQVVNGVAVKTSVSHPINISPLVPPELLEYLSTELCGSCSGSSSSSSDHALPDAPFVLRPSVATDLLSVTAAYVAAPSTLPKPTVAPRPLGNFVLSSCPGKKVRMNGEPKQGGRGAICRDVSLDLQRARDEHNVRLVVCCLDDDELAYLGVPWSEYSAALDALGMDVVRLPMVEGFAPSGPQELDAVLSRIVRRYTLRGASVLAHCRGGIGRAGLVASAWMVKMGLVAGPRDGEDGAGLWEGEEPLRIVERVVELVRRRRSIKAIETPHQVHFLLSYIEYLQRHAQIMTADDLARDSDDGLCA
ncbi:hypothetical protein DMC30DRAFT_414300 [Rhodotorula diobovata]|uniref:Tyrosine specific protein phosphatases domain-containing protein n=1 Tax=Rhodotorula diobovata TaxID=5288 RepID=A0A5C5G462_9BASI|nr:hypothetical protein DMC30DRAFT_414300 [Rhodotorula diobovata]